MPIYTKTGDKGETSLFGGKRVSKADPQVNAYGNLDELTSIIGMAILKLKPQSDKDFLLEIQKDLYQMMAFLSGAPEKLIDVSTITQRIQVFETKIDSIEKQLPKLTRFILPGGSELSAWFHIARTVCRRAERSVVELNSSNKKLNTLNSETVGIIIQYLNRLSDLFFDLARWYNKQNEILT